MTESTKILEILVDDLVFILLLAMLAKGFIYAVEMIFNADLHRQIKTLRRDVMALHKKVNAKSSSDQ